MSEPVQDPPVSEPDKSTAGLSMFRLAIEAHVYLNIPALSEEQAIEMGKKIVQIYKDFGIPGELQVELATLDIRELNDDEMQLIDKIDYDDICGYFKQDGEVSVEDETDMPEDLCAYCGGPCPENSDAGEGEVCAAYTNDPDDLYEEETEETE